MKDLIEDVLYSGRGIRVADLDLKPSDIVFFSALLFFSVLTVVVKGGVRGQIFKNLVVGLVFLGAIYLDRMTSSRALKFWIRLAAAQLMFAYVFPLVTPFQLIVDRSWNDAAVLGFEQSVFGVQPTVWIQKLISPAFTEWMMFAYVMWLPLYPILCSVFYFKRGEKVMDDFIFALAVANLACALCFILFPVAGPLYWIAGQYTVPLKGYLFTAAGEFIRLHFQGIGSSLPSPHCACATVMWLSAYRHHRPTFFVISPLILSIYISSFYARYHYISDVILGIMAGATVWIAVPFLINLRKGRGLRRQTVWNPE
jgi:membrane-associated phospholipid phosphatase